MSKARMTFSGMAVALAAIIVWTAPQDTRPGQVDDEKEAMAALFGGRPSGTSTKASAPRSLFDSQFWGTGVGQSAIPDEGSPAQPEEEPEILEKASEGNPINPQTGMPYTDEQMAQFDTLRKKFPNNSIIPQRITPELQQQIEEERRRIVEIQQRITARKASKEDIITFYDFQMKGMKDRVELLEYVLEKMGDEMDDDMKAKYTSVLEGNKKQIENLESQKEKAIRNAVQ
jgi:hypothetical protein